uniref:Uncharacterized protein n=1 Tax=Ditylenchus dipsaci TaxID=166011 RepID=A0A915E163_9BILA
MHRRAPRRLMITKIAQLEQEVFSVVKQLDETKDLLSETRKQNAQLQDQANSFQTEKLERAKYVQSLERNRDESIVEKTELQNTKIKRHLTEELITMRTECARAKKEQCLLQMKIDEFNTEKNLIAYDKERWSREKEILVQGKQWCMNEISNREMKLNELRIEMIKLEAKVQREKFALSQEKDALSTKVEEQSEIITRRRMSWLMSESKSASWLTKELPP